MSARAQALVAVALLLLGTAGPARAGEPAFHEGFTLGGWSHDDYLGPKVAAQLDALREAGVCARTTRASPTALLPVAREHEGSQRMKAYEPAMSFDDEETARRHDVRGDEAEAVAFLQRMAGSGPVLELAIGTGRLALPLAERGLEVQGIDIAPAMLERLRARPGGDAIPVVLGDFADVAVEGRFALVFVAWNSLFNLTRQEDQLRCFENVAAHLGEDGVFVVEAFTPGFLYRLPGDQQVAAESIEVDAVRIGVLQHDPATQSLEQSHVTLSPHGIRLNPVAQRYAWPAELDLMARLAGLRLKQRHGDWSGAPFTSESGMHVSVYGR